MQIGTPLSPAATRVMLLGAGELGKEVVIAFQRLGVEVIAVDRYPAAPGHQVAHRAHTIDMTDPVALAALIEQERPQYVIPEIEAIATQALQRVEDEGLATVIPTARATRLTMDREGIRRLAAEELGLPTSPYAFADTLDEVRAAVDGGIGYPCVIKPVMSSSGKGQSVLRSAADLQPSWDYAMAGGRVAGTRVIVEGFVEFDYEITQLTVRAPAADGTGLVTLATQRLSEFELHARAVLGLPVDVALRNAGASAVIYGGVDAKAVAFEGVDEALAVPGTDIRLFGKPESFRKRRMGVAVAGADDVDVARERATKAAGLVRVVTD
ncbi:formate-dependent phosphoribosylglycinamide formyltransferase [Pseudonocardia ailaonensis]|uniref:Formate-dependent phosphoribosylglycinamide formyltransferase n=1 Tax=Pseudonocardia ailaonensis TaxID=367279 RepID=A0ABN2MLF3_9PSEU